MQEYLELLAKLRTNPRLADQLRDELTKVRLRLPRNRPAFSDNTRYNQAAQPVVGVCLFEARAYAAWLSFQCGKEVRLPTEAEWEVAAASGTSRRRWPHGDFEPDFDLVNHDQTHLWRTSPVGVFSRGDTRPDSSGLTDMAGNILEWTASAYTERHDPVSPITICQDDSALRVVRGGTWNFTTEYCRASYRNWNHPHIGYDDLGLRLVRRRVPHSEP